MTADTLEKIKAINKQIEDLERQLGQLIEEGNQTDSEGYGVQLLYDYDYHWIVEEMRDGEWEMVFDSIDFKEALDWAEDHASELERKLLIIPDLPSFEHRTLRQ